MYFQATVAALVCLTAACVGFTESFLFNTPFQTHAKYIGFEADEEVESWFGKRRDLFYLYKHSGVIDLYEYKLKLPVRMNWNSGLALQFLKYENTITEF